MRFPIVEAYGTKRAGTEEFRGLSRLPVCAEGEAAIFKNLSCEVYPAARTDFFCERGNIRIYDESGAAAVCAGESIGYVFELTGEDNMLTGVYGGNFYYRGRKVSYYGPLEKDFKINANDRIEMLKLGKRYVILAVGEYKSSIWTYTPDGTSFGTSDEREGDGYLKTDIIGNLIKGGYIFRMCPNSLASNVMCRVARCEAASGKRYYCFVPNIGGTVGKNYTENVKKLKLVEKYIGHYGTVLYMTPSADVSLNSARYCFDDFKAEHPVRFVVDAAGTKGAGGEISPIDALCEMERERYGAEFPTGTTVSISSYCPYDVSGTEQMMSKYDYDSGELLSKLSFASASGVSEDSVGIIGHFERWNEEKQRYDFADDEIIYGISDESGAERTGFEETSGSNKRNKSKTALPIAAVGVMTEAVCASHICEHGGRVCASSGDGSQLILSAQGEYSNFADFASGASSSGFIESLTAGEFTAICKYSGYLMLFKRGEVCIYYGSGANDIALAHRIKVGCIDKRSIAEVGGVLYWLAGDGFYAFSGAGAEKISRRLEREYTSAVSFADGERYAAVCESASGRETLEYDPRLGVWSEKSAPGTAAVCSAGDAVILKAGTLYKRTAEAGVWRYESGDIFDAAIDDKGVNEIYIRARIKGEMKVYTLSDGVRYEHKKITSDGAKIGVWRVSVRLMHKNYYRIGIEGTGSATLYRIERTTYEGGRAK